MKRITIRVSDELHKRMREIAKDAATTMSNWASMALRRSARNWDASVEPAKKKGEKRQPMNARWPSGWPKAEPCPECRRLDHDPLDVHNVLDPQQIRMFTPDKYKEDE